MRKSLGRFVVLVVMLSTAHAAVVTWDNGSGDNKWSTAANWSPDTAPVGLSGSTNDFAFAGVAIQAFGGVVEMQSLTGGDSATIRIRNAASQLAGDLVMVGSEGAGTRIWNADAADRGLIVTGTSTFGGFSKFDAQQSGWLFTLDFADVIFQSSSSISSIRAGDLVFNADSLQANGNTFAVEAGSLQLGGTADYSGLGVDVWADAELIVSNNISVAGLTLDGDVVAAGTYNTGDAIFTTYSELVDGGGSLTVIPEPATLGLVGLVSAMLLGVRRVFLMG